MSLRTASIAGVEGTASIEVMLWPRHSARECCWCGSALGLSPVGHCLAWMKCRSRMCICRRQVQGLPLPCQRHWLPEGSLQTPEREQERSLEQMWSTPDPAFSIPRSMFRVLSTLTTMCWQPAPGLYEEPMSLCTLCSALGCHNAVGTMHHMTFEVPHGCLVASAG